MYCPVSYGDQIICADLEFAWTELLKMTKSVTVEELAELCVLECDI